MSAPAFVMAAPNGARRGKADHPNLPITPAELAAEAVRCRDAGAAALHLHVRDGEGAHSLDAGLYREALDEVRAAAGTELVLQITTEAVGLYGADEQMACARAVRPEAVSVALRELLPPGAALGPVVDFLAWARDLGVWTQVILYDAADVARFAHLHQAGVFAARRPSVLLVLGRYADGQRAEPAELDPRLDALDPLRGEVEWAVCAFGPAEHGCIVHALDQGGHVRVGFENNLQLPDGDRAAHTADLVGVAADAVRAAGRPLLDAAGLRRCIADWR